VHLFDNYYKLHTHTHVCIYPILVSIITNMANKHPLYSLLPDIAHFEIAQVWGCLYFSFPKRVSIDDKTPSHAIFSIDFMHMNASF
jgi:hypothetical protein